MKSDSYLNNLESESGDQVGYFDEKTRGWKSHADVPLRRKGLANPLAKLVVL